MRIRVGKPVQRVAVIAIMVVVDSLQELTVYPRVAMLVGLRIQSHGIMAAYGFLVVVDLT